MSEDWEKIKRRRLKREAAKHGYEQARLAFELGERVRGLREEQGLSQTELAKRIGSTQPSVARLEAGGVTPSLDTLDRIATAFGLTLLVDFKQSQLKRGRSHKQKASA